jgi:ATP-binding cassette subfamily C protein
MTRLRPARYVLHQVWQEPAFAVQSLLLVGLMGVVNLPLPFLNLIAIDHIIPAGQATPLILLGVLAFVVRAAASGFQVLQNYVVRRVMAGMGHRLRTGMIEALLRAPYAHYVTGSAGSEVGRLAADVTQVEALILDTYQFVGRPAAMIGVMVAAMSFISVPATLLIIASVPASVYATARLSRGLRELNRKVLAKRQELQHAVTEVLDNVRLVRSFNRESYYEKELAAGTAAYAETAVNQETRLQLMRGVIEILRILPWLVIVAAGAIMVAAGSLTLGELMALLAFEQLLRSPLGQLTSYLLRVRADMVAPERIQEVLELPREPGLPGRHEDDRDTGTATAEPVLTGAVRLVDVTFSYRTGQPVLPGLSLDVAAGDRVALVGASGAGKTTLMNLLLGLYRPNSGAILYDETPLTALPLAAVRRQVGIVFQDNPMFNASVRENLLLGREWEDAELWLALERADAADFVNALPLKLDTIIGVSGLKLSGGQRQRVAIARIMLREPKLVLLDEATSSLDSVSELHIRQALDRLLAGRTSVTIAHRLSTVVESSIIHYLQDGAVIESGSHRELVEAGGRYAELVRAQTVWQVAGQTEA